MTFAGDVAEGAYARLMKANFDRLIDGAVGAARASHDTSIGNSPDLAILISCVGEYQLQQRIGGGGGGGARRAGGADRDDWVLSPTAKSPRSR